MARADLIAKIRKCLALAKGASEHEAAAALSRARQLMEQYGVDEVDVALSEVGEAVAVGGGAQKPPRWELVLVCSITRAIPTHAILGAQGITFVGLTPAPEIASYAFTVLHRQLKQARQQYVRTRLKRCTLARKRARADVFCEGWASAVFNAVMALYPATPLDPVVRSYLDRRYANLPAARSRAPGIGGQVAAGDRARGHALGRDIKLQHGVASAAPLPRLGHG